MGFALEAGNDVVPAPGGENGFPGPFALAILCGLPHCRNQLGQGQIIDIQFSAPLKLRNF
jgi:hypothetical protein